MSFVGARDRDLVPLLAEYLPNQRWFAAKGIELDDRDITITHRGVVAENYWDADIEQVLFTVVTPAGTHRYQIWVGWTWQIPDRLAHAAIGVVEGRTAYDALSDVHVSGLLLEAIDQGRDFGDGLRAIREADAKIDTGAEGLVIGAEQSNTSIVYGHSAILKMYRRLEPGPNPDAEIHRALRAVGSVHIAEALGELVGNVDGVETTLGLLTEFFANSAEGWAMATSSVRDLMSEGDLRADEVGGDFASEAFRLGEAVAAVHADLARAFGTNTAPHDELARILDEMRAEANTAADLVPSLAEHRKAILAAFDRASDHAAGINVQRIHGDLHLGQVLRTLNGWSIIDFEGEPSKPLAYRRAMHSPLKDVAGMLRSFDYAARGLVISPHTDAQHKYRAAEWADRNRRAFCDGYAAAAGTDPRLAGSLLRAFELDKAIYEVVYEHGHRPLWEAIPLQAVVALINTGGIS
jgi:maltokinase